MPSYAKVALALTIALPLVAASFDGAAANGMEGKGMMAKSDVQTPMSAHAHQGKGLSQKVEHLQKEVESLSRLVYEMEHFFGSFAHEVSIKPHHHYHGKHGKHHHHHHHGHHHGGKHGHLKTGFHHHHHGHKHSHHGKPHHGEPNATALATPDASAAKTPLPTDAAVAAPPADAPPAAAAPAIAARDLDFDEEEMYARNDYFDERDLEDQFEERDFEEDEFEARDFNEDEFEERDLEDMESMEERDFESLEDLD